MANKIHRMQLKPLPFEKIKAGTKTIELRLNDPKRQAMMPGDTLVFFKEPELVEMITATLIARLHYQSFDELTADFPPERMGYDGPVTDHGMEKYYSKEDELRYGALGLKIHVQS